MSSPLRTRLTLWYVGAFSVVLILFSGGVYFVVKRVLVDRIDANLRITLQMTGSALARNTQQSTPFAQVLEDPRFSGQIVALVESDGTVLARRPSNSTAIFRIPALPLRASPSPQLYELRESNSEADDSCRGIYQLLWPVAEGAHSPIIVVTASTEPLSDQLDALQDVLAIAVVLALLLTGCGGWLLAGRSLSPLAAMASATERITANNLGERLPVKTADELGRLASRFNELLSRLDTSFSQQRQFMADASHELRTPLSVVRTEAQVALQKAERPEPEYREALTTIEQQAGRLSRIVEDMFALTRADMNQLPLALSELYLDEVITDTVRAFDVLAQRKGVHLRAHDLQESPYRGDEHLLRQMISNLLENALKHTPQGGNIRAELESREAEYLIIVADTGAGIPVENQPHIFERFYRADKARSGTEGGTDAGAGLGLPIANWIAEAHHGRLELLRSDHTGTAFIVSLPRT